MKIRCDWVPENIPEYVTYHDKEWGMPLHDDIRFFELLCLEGAQAGLSWLTVLRKREAYRKAYRNFDPQRVVLFGENDIGELLSNPGIIRNRRKIESSIRNAGCFLKVCEEAGSFDAYIWDFVDGAPIVNRWQKSSEIPAVTPLAETISRDMKKRGFNYIGPTIVYAFLQSSGVVNDHIVGCFRHTECIK